MLTFSFIARIFTPCLLLLGALLPQSFAQLEGKKILYIEREQYAPDHHNTATLFQPNQVNTDSFKGGSAMRILDVDTQKITTLLSSEKGVIRDPELSYDGKKIIFSMRHNIEDCYHIYEMNVDGSNLTQLTYAADVSDIDPIYLPDGDIIFSSTRQPKFCMCNRHIMANLYRMEADGANIQQLGFSTLFEGHATVMNDGRILYDRWEYVDRNFADAQGLWTVNPDGTKHAIYYGNNTKAPDGVIDARQIPNSDLVVCIFGSCHDRPWGALAVIDRRKGVDGKDAVVAIFPESSRAFLDTKATDIFKKVEYCVEDPYPISQTHFLVSSTAGKTPQDLLHSSLYLMGMDGSRQLILQAPAGSKLGLFDPILLEAREKPPVIPSQLP